MRSLIIRFFILLAGFIFFSAAPSIAATVTYSPSFTTGWNLAGNSLTTAINVKTTFGTQASIQTIWKWDAAGSKWAFYAPALDTAGTLTGYATSKGYSALTTINPGEGYWVNASAPVSLGTPSGTGFSLAASNLVTGWNLTATGDDITPATLTVTLGNVTTLWAWDNANSAWYFYAPSMAANNSLTSYINGKGYKDFGTLTLGKGRGFWVNKDYVSFAGTWTGNYNGTALAYSITQTGNNITLTRTIPPLAGLVYSGIVNGNAAVVTTYINNAAMATATYTLVSSTTINAVVTGCFPPQGYSCAAPGSTVTLTRQ